MFTGPSDSVLLEDPSSPNDLIKVAQMIAVGAVPRHSADRELNVVTAGELSHPHTPPSSTKEPMSTNV
jgi:hypothetical protein